MTHSDGDGGTGPGRFSRINFTGWLAIACLAALVLIKLWGKA